MKRSGSSGPKPGSEGASLASSGGVATLVMHPEATGALPPLPDPQVSPR
jgi:hypothetical protein